MHFHLSLQGVSGVPVEFMRDGFLCTACTVNQHLLAVFSEELVVSLAKNGLLV